MEAAVVLLGGLILFSGLASAEQWQIVTDTPEGVKPKAEYFLDLDSMRYVEQGNKFLVGAAKMVDENDNLEKYQVAIDYDSCIRSRKGVIVITSSMTQESGKFQWTYEGPAIFDAMGTFMCSYVLKSLQTR